MGGISGQSEFTDYHATGGWVAAMPSVSAVSPGKNKPRYLEYVHPWSILRWINRTGTSRLRNMTLTESGIEELRWN